MSKILVPFDHSDNALLALKQALLIAKRNSSSIEVFHVINLLVSRDLPIDWSESDQQQIKDSLQKKIDLAKSEVYVGDEVLVSVELQRGERVADEVLMRADETDTVLIVMGTHGITGMLDRLLGTNSLDVMSESKWPVLLIPPHWKAVDLENLVVASVLEELVGLTDSIKSLSKFFHLPVRAIQLTGVIETKEIEDKDVDGIPFQYVPSSLEFSLAKNLREYAKTLHNSVLVMYIHPRKFFQKLLDVSLTEETAKVIQIPLLSIRKDQ